MDIVIIVKFDVDFSGVIIIIDQWVEVVYEWLELEFNQIFYYIEGDSVNEATTIQIVATFMKMNFIVVFIINRTCFLM